MQKGSKIEAIYTFEEENVYWILTSVLSSYVGKMHLFKKDCIWDTS